MIALLKRALLALLAVAVTAQPADAQSFRRYAPIFTRHAAAPQIVLSVYKVATTNNRLASAGYNGTKGRYQTSGTRTAFTGQIQQVFPAAYSQIRIVVPGAWFISDSTGEQALAAPFTIDKMTVRSGDGNKSPVTFGGSRSLAVQPGVDFYMSDPITLIGTTSLATADTTNTRLAIGFQGHVAASGDYIPQATPAYFKGDTDPDNARVWMYDPAAASPNIDSYSSYIPAPSGAVAISFSPSFIAVGIPKAPTRAVVIFGDSLTAGYNENVDASIGANYPSEFGVMGPYGRAGYDYPNGYPPLQQTAYLLTGVHSEFASQFNASHAHRAAFLQFGNIAHVAYGTNYEGSVAVEEAALSSIYDLARANPNIQKVLGSTLPPRTSGGVPVSGFELGGDVDTLNAWIAAGAGGRLDGYADLRAAVRAASSGANSVKWATGYSDDETHWNATSAPLAAAPIRALWMGQTVH